MSKDLIMERMRRNLKKDFEKLKLKNIPEEEKLKIMRKSIEVLKKFEAELQPDSSECISASDVDLDLLDAINKKL